MILRTFTARLGLIDPDAVDATRSTGSVFAPSWDLLGPLLQLRRETGRPESPPQWARFAERYLDEMRGSHHRHEAKWNALLARPSGRVVLLCFCPDPARCHRTLLARDILPKLGAEYAGELTAISRKEMRRRAALAQTDLFPTDAPAADEALGRAAPPVLVGVAGAPAPDAAPEKPKWPPMDARPRHYAIAARGGPDGTGPAAFAVVVRLPDGTRSITKNHSTHNWSRTDMAAFAHHSFVELPVRTLAMEGVPYVPSRNDADHALAERLADEEYECARYEIDPAGYARRALAQARVNLADPHDPENTP